MIVFDLETTGLPKAEGSDLDIQPRIIEFGAIKVDDNFKEVDRFQFLCSPGFALDPYIIKLTKITDDMQRLMIILKRLTGFNFYAVLDLLWIHI